MKISKYYKCALIVQMVVDIKIKFLRCKIIDINLTIKDTIFFYIWKF